MQKDIKSLLLVVCIALFATLVVVACGDGVQVKLDDFLDKVMTSEEQMAGEAEKPDSPIWKPPSSSDSGGPGPSSQGSGDTSSSQGGGGTSSQGGGGDSSQSVGGTSSSQGSGTSSVAPSSSSSIPQSSAAPPQSTTGCASNSPKSGFTCGWNISGSSTTPGKQLKPANATLPGDCQSVVWKYVDNDDDMTLQFGCNVVPDAGITTAGQKKYLLFAELNCNDGKHTTACNPGGLSTLKAPGLTGTCVWKRSNGDVVTETTQARGAIPGGVTIVDTDHVCGSTLPSVVYKYDSLGKTATWPKDGGPLGIAKTYTDVQATVTCSAYDVAPTTCPALIVKGGADHQITCTNDKCNEVKGVKSDECIDVEIDWKDSGNFPMLKIACQVDRNGASSGAVTIKVGSNKSESGNDYLAVDMVKITKVGLVEVSNICVSFPDDKARGNCRVTQ